MLILAIDPGVCTGYAIAAISDRVFDVCYGQEYFDPKQFWKFLDQALPNDLECYVIYESFEFRQGKQLGVDLYPCELIGILKLHRTFYVDMTDHLWFQPASVQGKKAYFSDARLKELGVYQKGVEHGRSAVKHLLHWILFGAGSKFMQHLDNAALVEEEWFRSKYLERG